MLHLIGKSGTGIGKSGTGIGKSGTGIGSGTGSRAACAAGALFLGLAASFAQPALAGDAPGVRVIEHGEVVLVSVQQGDEVLMGAAALSEQAAGYYAIDLYTTGHRAPGFGEASTMVKGSGSGSSGNSACTPEASLMVKGSGSGSSGNSACTPQASLMVKGSGSGSSGDSACTPQASLMVKGSGSGSSGDSACTPQASLMVKGSGSGSSGDSACTPQASLMVKGSGSGNSSESTGNCTQGAWGVAELLFDEGGANLIVHRRGGNGFEELLVAYLPRSGSVTGNGSREVGDRGFVSAP